jgi:molybdate transport system substrate-binding protein
MGSNGESVMRVLLIAAVLTFVSGCEMTEQSGTPPAHELLIYCGITMAKPMQEIADIVEREKGVRVTLTQGGSEDLYKSLAASRVGDLYLPGSASYRERHLHEGLLGDFVHVGYNQAALVVKKGNPLALTNDPVQMTRPDLAVVIADAATGSIGRETKRILEHIGIYEPVRKNAVFLTTDSRNLNRAMHDGEADVILNWRATAFFDENRAVMDVIDLGPELAKPKKLLLNRLVFSRHPEIAGHVMQVASSERGQAIFRKYGFIGTDGR